MLRRSNTRLSSTATRTASQAFTFSDGRYVPVGRWPFDNFVGTKQEGSYMWAKSDKAGAEDIKFLDLVMGIGVCNLGHRPAEVVAAVHEQVDRGFHFQIGHGYSDQMERFLGNMIKSNGTDGDSTPYHILPAGFDSVLCVTTGSEAVEAAIKLSRNANPGRPVLAGIQGGYHGRTLGALSLTTSKYSYATGVRPFIPGCVVLPPPYHSTMKESFTTPVSQLSARCLEMAEDVLTQQCHGSEVSMLIVEPTLGEGGFVPLPAEYWAGLRDLCTRNGILLCADEVQSGFGRTGSLFAFEQYGAGATPDMITFAKGVANGLPLAGLATRKDIAAKCAVGTQGGTYSGNAVALASANAGIEHYYGPADKRKKLLDNVWARSRQFVQGMLTMIEKHNLPIDEIRGRGLMLGIEWNRDVPGIGTNFTKECFKRQLLLPTTGKFQACRVIPSLQITESEVSTALAIMEEAAVAAVAATPNKEAIKKALGGKNQISHFFEDGKFPASEQPDVPLRWVTVRK